MINHYWKKINKYHTFFIVIVSIFLAYGGRLFSLTIGIDTEILINNPYTPYNWLTIGRQGGYFLRKFLEFGTFSPFYAASLSAFFLLIAYCIWHNLLSKYLHLVEWHICIFWLLFIIHPIWEEQAYFELQLIQISLGIALLGVIITNCFICATQKKYWLLTPTLLGAILLFSIYQSFVILFIAASCLVFLLYCTNNEKQSAILSYCIIFISIFLISYAVNTIVTQLWFGSSDYLTSQIQWGKLDFSLCVNNIFNHILQVITGSNIFFTLGYAFSAVFIIGITVIQLFSSSNNENKILYLLALFLFEFSPFLLTIYMGMAPLIRTQWALPFVIAGNFVLILECIKKYKKSSIFFAILALFFCIQHFFTVSRLEYTDHLRYQNDIELSNIIGYEIEKINPMNKPVAFIGNRPFNIPASGVRGEIIGISFFDFDMISEPHYYVSSTRIVAFMNAIGIDMTCISPEYIIEAREFAQKMPCWPENGSILDVGNFIVVKLSEDQYYLEDFKQDLQR